MGMEVMIDQGFVESGLNTFVFDRFCCASVQRCVLLACGIRDSPEHI